MDVLHGIAAAGGRVRGPVHVVEERPAAPVTGGMEAFQAAAERVAGELEGLAEGARSRTAQGADVLDAQAMMLRDVAITEAVEAALGRGTALAEAVERAFEEYAAQIEALGDEYLRARAQDVREASRLLLRALAGGVPGGLASLSGPRVAVARELSPADTLSADPALLLGVVTETGGRTSHAAIVARELGIPAVMGVAGAVAAARGAAGVDVDGDAGTVRFTASAAPVAAAGAGAALALGDVFVRLMSNAGSPAAVRAAAARGARGIGLFRTELLFLGRDAPVDEEEQARVYAEAGAAMAPHPVVVRTLDAGSDKALPYLGGSEGEPNPALGRRGIRLWLAHPELARAQARALLRAAAAHPNLRVMLPMVSSPSEVRAARSLFEREAASLGTAVPHLGMMLETPAAAASLDAYAGLVDFISLGTNDLAQYALAADRELQWPPELTEWNPGVLRLIERALTAARALGIEAGACGEMAGSPEGAAFLAGAGCTSLSMAAASLPAVAATLRRLGPTGSRAAAQQALG